METYKHQSRYTTSNTTETNTTYTSNNTTDFTPDPLKQPPKSLCLEASPLTKSLSVQGSKSNKKKRKKKRKKKKGIKPELPKTPMTMTQESVSGNTSFSGTSNSQALTGSDYYSTSNNQDDESQSQEEKEWTWKKSPMTKFQKRVISLRNNGCPKFLYKFTEDKFFLIRTESEDDLHKSIKYGVWCSSHNGNVVLSKAYQHCQTLMNSQLYGEDLPHSVFLLFCVPSNGYFVGLAKINSNFNKDFAFSRWLGNQDRKGLFRVEWVIVKDVPSQSLECIENKLEDQNISCAECQEVDFASGRKAVEIVSGYQFQGCLLDDLNYFEEREKKLMEMEGMMNTQASP